MTNDVAFRERNARRCGFDEGGYTHKHYVKNGSGSYNDSQQQQVVRRQSSSQVLVKEESYLFQSGTKPKERSAAVASPMGVNELDFPSHFEWAGIDDKAVSNNTKQSHSTKLNIKRSTKTTDDDTFFYSESAPSEATTDTKLVGEEITLGSSSSYLQSFDILENNRKVENNKLTHQMMVGRGSPIRLKGSGGGGGGGGGGLSQVGLQMNERKEVDTVVGKDVAKEVGAVAVAAPPTLHSLPVELEPTPPPQSQPPTETSPSQTQPTNNSNNTIAINNDNNNNNTDNDKKPAGCAVPEVLQEFVDDIRSVLTQVISVAYLACSESEQCLSRCGDDTTTTVKKVQLEPPLVKSKSMLDTIEEDHHTTNLVPLSKVVEAKSSKGGEVWTGDYLSNRTGTEETAENSSQGGERSAEGGKSNNRFKKFLSLVKSRK